MKNKNFSLQKILKNVIIKPQRVAIIGVSPVA